MSTGRGTTGLLAVWLMIAAAEFFLVAATARAAPPMDNQPVPSIQRIDVPDDRSQDWPFRDEQWIPIPRSDFERQLARILPARRPPLPSDWKQCHYTAEVVGDALVMGRLEARLSRPGTARDISLGRPSLAFEELSWGEQSAVWGARLDRRQVVLATAEAEKLNGRWTARGRVLNHGVAFDLELLPADVSSLELQVPVGLEVHCDVGDVRAEPLEGDSRTHRWAIALGHHSRCRLIISPVSSDPPAAPVFLYEHELSVTVSSDEMLLRPTFVVDALEGNLSRLTVSMPLTVEITSVTFGDQSPLRFERLSVEGPAAQWLIHFPEPIQGRSRTIRLEATLRRSGADGLSVPQFLLEGGIWQDGRINVTVIRPWELRSFRATGYRQISPGTQRPEGDSTTFQQITPRAQLVLNVDRPAWERVAHALNVLRKVDSVWTLTTEIAWGSRSGTVFDVSCRIPAGWRVMSVVQLGGGRESQELSGWELLSDPVAGQLLLMEFPEGLTPGRINSVRVIAQQVNLGPQSTLPLSCITPLDCETSEVLLSCQTLSGQGEAVRWRDLLEPWDVSTAAAVWNTLPSWSDVIDGSAADFSLYHVSNPEGFGKSTPGQPNPRLPAESEFVREAAESTTDVLPQVARESQVPAPARLADFELYSRLTSARRGFDYHELWVFPAGDRFPPNVPFQMPEPAEFLAAEQEQRPLVVTNVDRCYELTFGPEALSAPVVIRYRTPAENGLASGSHQLILPQFSGPSDRFSWQVAIPSELAPYRAPEAVVFATDVVRPGWWNRLWGPLGQKTTARPNSSRAAGIVEHRWSHQAFGGNLPRGWIVYSATGMNRSSPASFIVWNRATLDSLNWAIFLGCLPLGLVLRRGTNSLPRPAVSTVMAAAACGAIFGPDGWNLLCGGLFSGLLLSLLLPVEFWHVPSPAAAATSDGSISTQLFRRAALPVVLWLLCQPDATGLVAQDPADKPASDPTVKTKLRVLVPVDEGGQPSQSLPVVYVSPALSELLREPMLEPPRALWQLIESADYVIRADEPQRLILKVKYRLARPDTEESAELLIPIAPSWKSGLEACSIDGEVTPATFSADQQYLTLLPAAATSRSPSNPDTQSRLRHHEILLEIRLVTPTGAASDAFQADLFPVLNSRLTWQSSQTLPLLDVAESRGMISMSLDRRLMEAQLGATERVTVRRPSSDRAVAENGSTQLQTLQLLTLRPSFTHVAFRIDCRVLSGTIPRLELRLPVGAVMREVRGHRFLQTHTQSQIDTGSSTVVEFIEPLDHDFAVEGEYVLPKSTVEQAVEVPHMQVRAADSAAPTRNLFAVTSGSDFVAQLINPADPSVLPIPVEQFISPWGDTVPTQSPQFCFQVQEGGQPSLRLTQLLPEQELLSWREDVAVSRRRIDWTLTADFKTARFPTFAYTVLLDRRLTIENVSLRENGVESLLRWSKAPMIGSSQNRLTLFLSREVIGVCQVKIQGHLHVRPGTPIVLPSIRFESPHNVSGILALTHEANHKLVLEGRQTPLDPAAVPVAESGAASTPATTFKRLKIQEGDSNLTARLDAIAGASTVRALWWVHPEDATWRVRGWMELTPREGTREIRIDVPPWMNSQPEAVVANGLQIVDEIVENHRSLQVTVPDGSAEPITLYWDANWTGPGQTQDELTLPSPWHAESSQVWAAMPSGSNGRPLAAPLQPVQGAPAAIQQQLMDWDASDVESLAIITDDRLKFQRGDAHSADGSTSVASIEHVLRGTAAGGWIGRTSIELAPHASGVEMVLPPELTIVSLTAGGQPRSLDELQPDPLRWRIVDGQSERRYSIEWTLQASTAKQWIAGRAMIPLPKCLLDHQPKTWVILFPGDLPQRIITPQLAHRGIGEFVCDQLELDLAQLLSKADRDHNLSRRIWRDYQQAAEFLARPDSLRHWTAADRTRWEAITTAMSTIERPAEPPHETEHRDDSFFAALLTEDARTGVLPPQSAELPYVFVQGGVVDGMLGVLLFAVCLWILPKVVGGLFSAWWQTRPQAAWLALGLLWWLCLTPPIVGLAMIAWSIWRMLWQPRSRPAMS